MKGDELMERVYDIQNLNCAHCGGLIEEAINKLDGIDSAVLIFTTKKLKVSGNLTSETERIMNETAQNIEDGVKIVPESADGENEEEESFGSQICVLLCGIAVYAAAIITGHFNIESVSVALFAASYLILGFDILIATFKNIRKGNIFDENFLMTIATVGAFALGEFSEAVGVVLFFKIGEIFEDFAVCKSRKAITAAAGLKVNEVDLLTNGDFVRAPSESVHIGDVIRVKVGDRIAVDGVVESGSTRLDTSAINGEPVPASVNAGDKVLSGCINMSDVITVKATAEAGQSMIAKIADAVENASASKPKIDRFITRFAKIYTPIVIAIAVATALIPSIITGDWSKWVYTALTFLVISCPCALVLSVPLAYFSGIGAASKLGILFKGGYSIEALANVKAIAFDKTGTITNGTFSVTEVNTYGDMSCDDILSLCGTCEEASTHPVAVSIVKYCEEKKIKFKKPICISELSGRGVWAELDGAEVLCGNLRLMNENNIVVNEENANISGSVVYVSYNGKAVGRVVVSDSIKATSEKAVNSLKKMGIYTAMLTGDKTSNAEATAKKLGIDYAKGELLPDEKLDEIKKIRETHGSVMFVGDGINDGPVLAGADVGGAMHSGADLALEAADAVFMNSELDSVVRAKKISDRTLKVSYQNIIFALVIKAAVLIFGIMGHPSMWFAVFADSGTAMLLILNSIKILSTKKYRNI